MAARHRLVEILTATKRLIDHPQGLDRSLAGGMAGVATFLNYLPDDLRSTETERQVITLLAQAVRAPGASFADWSLFEGETGVYWSLSHAARRWNSPEIEAILDDVDLSLLALLEQPPSPGHFDLIRGAVGLGVYALERLPREVPKRCLQILIDHLDCAATSDSRGLSWTTPTEAMSFAAAGDYPCGYVDLGVAHGVAGVSAFLALVHRAGIRGDRTASLAEQALTWLFAAAEPPASGLRFPFQVAQYGPPTAKRNAWCYGDAGIAGAVMVAATNMRSAKWHVAALDLARTAAACRGEEAGIVDAGLCHGASGLAHIFNRLYQHTGEPELLLAARHWAGILCDMRVDEGLAGYAAWSDEGWEADPGLLEGTAGVGLALAAAMTYRSPEWDRCFLLS